MAMAFGGSGHNLKLRRAYERSHFVVMFGSCAHLRYCSRHYEMGLIMEPLLSGVVTPEELTDFKQQSAHQEPKEAVVRLLAPSGGTAPHSIVIRCPIELRGTYEKWLVSVGNRNQWDAVVKSWLE